MQWNKIKLTFILAFLILNVYLVFQLFPQEETEQTVLETESQDAVLGSVKGYKELSDQKQKRISSTKQPSCTLPKTIWIRFRITIIWTLISAQIRSLW